MSRNSKSDELARKRLIKSRGHKCEVCGYPGYIELHHKQQIKDGGNNRDDDMLILLCEKCHAAEHGINKKKWIDPDRLSYVC